MKSTKDHKTECLSGSIHAISVFIVVVGLLGEARDAFADCKLAVVNEDAPAGVRVQLVSTGGRLPRFLSTEGVPVGVSSSGDSSAPLYLAERNPNQISRINIDGSVAETVIELENTPTAIALNSDIVFWAESIGDGSSEYRLLRAPASGGAATELVTGQGNVTGIDFDSDGRIYWTTESGEDDELTEGHVMSATAAGDDVQTVLDLNAASVSQGFINGSSLPTDITIDRDNGTLYVTDQISNNVLAPHVIWQSTLTGDGVDVFDSILACLPGNQSNCQVSDFSLAFSAVYNDLFVLSNTTQITRVYRTDVESKERRNVLLNSGHDIALLGPDEGLCMPSGSFSGSTLNEFSVWRPDFGTWFVVRQDGAPFVQQWGLPDDVPIAANFNGDSLLDMVVWRPTEGNWYLCDWNGTGVCSSTEVVQWGLPGDLPLPADFDGDGLADIAVWRPSEGRWYVRDIATRQWGLPDDIPLTADFNSDGRADYVVFRPSTGTWYVLYSSFEGDQPDGSATLIRQWGLPGDHPFAGDFDNDGRPDLVVWRPETGTWFICPSASEYTCPPSGTAQQFGLPGDIPVAGDFDADGVNDLAVWRPLEGNWYYLGSSSEQVTVRQWGLPGDVPTGYSTLELDRLN